MPVITKVEADQEDLNEEDDLEILQANIHNIFKNYLQNVRNQKEEEIKIKELSDSDETLNAVEDEDKMNEELAQLETFFD